jgi:predicted AlkP superfamily pyrophosphatase or phosphodiesterase
MMISSFSPRSLARCLAAAGFCFPVLASAQSKVPIWQEPPRLVVGIVVDQMRADYLYRYWNNFGEGGFKRLVAEGAFLRNVHFDYVPTYTAPGHASIYTGTSPAHHGIVANDMFVRTTGAGLYCVQDDRSSGVGGTGIKGQRSPFNLISGTIADELELRFDRRSKTIGIAMKDRGAILPIGRTGDAAYWFFEGPNGEFATSTWYMNELPKWVQDFNAQKLAEKYLNSTWDLLLPRERYHHVLPDENPYEQPLIGATSATLPQDLGALFKAGGGNTALLRWTPGSNTITTDFALAALKAEELGKDAITDLLAVSYGAPDELGHEMGARALEMEDMYLRLDLELARLFKALDDEVGKGRYTVFLTADHGAVDVAEYLKDLKGSAGYVDMQELAVTVNKALEASFGPGQWVRRRIKEQFFLNDSLIAVRKLDAEAVQRVAANTLLQQPFIAEALTASDLVRTNYPSGVRSMIQRGFMPQRSGDICFTLRPGHLPGGSWVVKKGSEHGSPWNYDSHVPLLFMGQGIVPGEVLRRVSITDIAPTISMLVGMTMPDAATGAVIEEVLVR